MASLAERLRKKKEDLKRSSSGGNFFTIKEGTTRMRHLPVGDENEFAFEVIFFYLGKELGGVVSPATFGKKCALMELMEKMKNSKSAEDRAWQKEHLRAGKKFFSPVIKYKDEDGSEVDTEAGVKLLILTSGLYQELIDLFLDGKEAGDFTDPENGYDIKYSRTGKGKTDTEYTLRPCKPTRLKKAYRGKIYDLEQMIKDIIPSYEETKSLVEQFTNMSHDEVSGDDNKKERRDRGEKKKKKRDL